MNFNQMRVALYTLVSKEIRRFMRIWPQTLLPPAITMSLYWTNGWFHLYAIHCSWSYYDGCNYQ